MKENSSYSMAYTLSKSQQNIWKLEQSFPGTSINNICETIRIEGTFDIALLQKALNLILESDSSLRTQIILDDEQQPLQYEEKYFKQQFPVFDFSATNQVGIRHWENSITREVMPLINSPLFYFAIITIGEHEGGVLIKTHHLISDGWSQVSLINKIARTYLALLNHEDTGTVVEPTPSYRLHVEEEQRYLSSKAYSRDQAFWEENLSGISSPVSIRETNNAEVSPVGQRISFDLTETLNHALASFCASRRVAPFAVFYMALAIYLKRMNNADKLCLGCPIHNRSNVVDRKTTGMFVSTLPFYCEINEQWSFEELNLHLEDLWLDLLRHQKFPFSEISAISRRQNPDLTRLFNLVLSFHNSQAYHNRDTFVNFSGQWHYSGYQAEHICIHLNNTEDEKRYSVNYDYLTQLFSKSDIEDFHRYLTRILSQALKYPDKPIYEYSLLDENELEKVLFSFNKTHAFCRELTLGEKLEEVYHAFPTRAAIIHNGKRYTYNDLNNFSAKIASQFAIYGNEEHRILAIMLPKSPELLFSMAAAARMGYSWVILPPELPRQRINEIVEGCCPSILISNTELLSGNQFAISSINVDNLPESSSKLPVPDCTPADIAYIVYTSGSTGKPKGVEIEQHSLLNFADSIKPLYGKGAVLSLCNIGFDAFLLESIVSLLNGQTVVLPFENEGENPSRLAELIRSYAVGFMALTPSRLTAYLKSPDFYRAAGQLETIICGGEAFPSSLLKALSRCTGAKICNQYGPSETTVGVTTGYLNTASLITVGAPMQNCRCYVLDSYLKPMPIGAFGSLYVGGLCVGRGYRNNPELTQKQFLPNPYESGERIYKTGDIAAWTDNGEIIIKGRDDGQIKLRGQRIELEEISSKLMLNPSILQAVVRTLDIEGQTMLVAYYISDRQIPEGELIKFAASYLPEYMIPSIFHSVKEIPLTANGKVNYAKLPIPSIHHSTSDLGVQSADAEAILAIFRRILKRADISFNDDYFLFGGDSLNALEAISEIEKEFSVRLRVADLYACRTALHIEPLISADRAERGDYTVISINKAPKMDSYPLTASQLGIYFETQMSPNSTAYNMPCGFSIDGKIDTVKLQAAFVKLIADQPILNTAFTPGSDGICQKAVVGAAPELELYRDIPLEAAKESFVRPFDLSHPPLVRLAVWEDELRSVIMLDMHHIIGDAVTAAQVLRDLSDLFSGRAIIASRISFNDYTYWLKDNAQLLEEKEIDYWRRQMENAPSLPEIPLDFARPKQFDYVGRDHELLLDDNESALCDKYCEDHGLTTFMFFAAAFGIFLSKLTGSNDIMIGTPVSSRRLPEIAEAYGLFVNTLPLRVSPNLAETINSYMNKVKESVIGLLDNPDITLGKLMELCYGAGSAQKSLYNTLISIRPIDTDGFMFDGKHSEPELIPAKSAKFDLNVEISKSHGKYCIKIQYASALFHEDTIALYGRSFATVIKRIVDNDEQNIADCSAVSPIDQYYIFDRPHSLRMPFSNLQIHHQIDAMAQIHPDSPAVIFHSKVTTLGEIKKRSDALAAHLISLGVKSGDCVGVLCRRGPELLIAMIAVLKAGGTYVPILPSFPENRIKSMLEISSVSLTLCDHETFTQLNSDLSCQIIDLSAITNDAANIILPNKSEERNEICCILFTSGSTGQPKGVMIRHSSICNLTEVMRTALITADGGFFCAANSIFDIFITETLIAMAFGRYSVMADEEEMVLPWKSAELISKHNVKLIEFTPSRAQLFINNPNFISAITDMPVAMMCGEVLPPQLLDRLRDAGCKKIYNLYGPTETTVYSTMADVTTENRITVGHMYPNCRGYVLDDNMRPVMPTASGELYFAGECLAAGYIGRQDLTENAFLPDPFFPGGVMYRSGDMVRLLPDGRIDFLGRRDHQVKLNGQRIELAEITQKILDSGLAERAATTVKKENNYMTLRAFIQPKDNINVSCAEFISEVRSYLSKELPAYMVPSEIQVMDALPCTASGKTDLKALETMPTAAPNKDSKSDSPTPPEDKPIVNSAENKADVIRRIWEETLSKKDIHPDISFFEQGGNSLAALNLLSSYYNHDLTMTLSDFYDHPTINDHMKHFGIEPNSDIIESAAAEMTKAENLIATPCEVHVKPKHYESLHTFADKNAVFLTGATGFLGSHLLKSLIDTGYRTVFCLVRGKSTARLYENLTWYFGQGWVQGHKAQIIAVPGDILENGLAIALETAKEIALQTAYVVHCAADVRHYSCDDSAERTNYIGTSNVIAFAKKCDAKLIHISTVSISGEYIVNSPDVEREFSEDDFEIGQNWRDGVYLRGKYRAEALVHKARNSGLSATIMRVGRLVGRYSDGVFQKNPSTNTFWELVNGMNHLNSLSHDLAKLPMELTAVDKCAEAAVLLMDEHDPVYHLFNPNYIEIGHILKSLNISFTSVGKVDFESHLKDRLNSDDRLKIAPLLSQYTRISQVPVRIAPICRKTETALNKKGFFWEAPNPSVLLQSFLLADNEQE